MNKRIITAILLATSLIFGTTACSGQAAAREAAQKASTNTGESQEIKNLKRKKELEDNPNTIRYLYLYSFGNPIGYYITKGKISSNGSQIGPELEVLRELSGNPVVDSPQDDGSFGDGDPGIFFFTVDGAMAVTNFDYLQFDHPTNVNVPQLYESKMK